MSFADRLIRGEQKKREEEVRNMVCPKCNAKPHEVGAMTIGINDDSEKNGHYCARCYRDWAFEHLPKFVLPDKL